MYLKSITMKGFKSFPDRTRMEFGPGTSVIVGPNGSGKSNVTDAVLWALGEQSPIAVRGQSMQDVIFGGVPGRQAAQGASVELILDDSEQTLGLGPEVSVMRRLDRNGEGEYRLAGARCRLIDVIEMLSDTGMGKEMHSVISQGRVEAIVTSKPKDRRLLIEEAAGLGKHRKRRRRAHLKLIHTQDNLDRALDVEREARSRLRPLKRQAEAAELHARLHRQMLEIRWELAREDLRVRQTEVTSTRAEAARAREVREELEAELEQVASRRRAAEEALAERSSQREQLSRRSFAAQSAADRIDYRTDSVRSAARTVEARSKRAEAGLETLRAQAAADQPDDGAAERMAALERELEALERDREAELTRQLNELEGQREAAEQTEASCAADVQRAEAERERSEAAHEETRQALREAERQVEAARRESARVGGELAAVNQFLRSHQSAPGGARSLADALSVASGYELAVAAALDGRLGAALVEDRAAAARTLERAGRDGGRVLLASASEPDTETPPAPRRPRARSAWPSAWPGMTRPPGWPGGCWPTCGWWRSWSRCRMTSPGSPRRVRGACSGPRHGSCARRPASAMSGSWPSATGERSWWPPASGPCRPSTRRARRWNSAPRRPRPRMQRGRRRSARTGRRFAAGTRPLRSSGGWWPRFSAAGPLPTMGRARRAGPSCRPSWAVSAERSSEPTESGHSARPRSNAWRRPRAATPSLRHCWPP